MQEYTAFIEEHLQGLGSSTAQLQSQLEKVGQACYTQRSKILQDFLLRHNDP